MFVVLDTNHFTELIRESDIGKKLQARLDYTQADVFLSVITAQESLEGWLALVNRHRAGPDQIKGYQQFRRSIEAIGKFSLLDFDRESSGRFLLLRSLLPRVGTMDLKIAAICLAHDAMVLTRNFADFEQVPGLRFENWLD